MATFFSARCERLSQLASHASVRRHTAPREAGRGYRAALRVRAAAGSEEPAPAPVQQQQQPAQPASPAAPSAPSPAAASSEAPKSNNGLLAGGAAGFGVALFLAARLATGGPSFAAMEAAATPIDVALSNGLPTVLEFYADYCEVRGASLGSGNLSSSAAQ